MSDATLKLPGYAKITFVLLGLFVFINILSIIQDLLLPLIYAVFLSILLSPAVNFLIRKKINRIFAISGVLLFALFLITLLVILLASQANLLSEAFPQLKIKFLELIGETVKWGSTYFNISEYKIDGWIIALKSEIQNNSGVIIGNTLTTSLSILATLILTPVYVFMLLFYKAHLLKFIHRIFGYTNDENTSEILSEAKSIIQLYIVGLFTEIILVAILNSVGLLILGINYAVLLGICGALLNIIPYLGGLITMFLFMIVALLTKEPVYILYVVAMYSVIQFVDNNYFVPKIVGSKVKLNALISLMAVIFGAALWGIPGMFLFIPIAAVVKVIFDRVNHLKPWGFLMGYDENVALK